MIEKVPHMRSLSKHAPAFSRSLLDDYSLKRPGNAYCSHRGFALRRPERPGIGQW